MLTVVAEPVSCEQKLTSECIGLIQVVAIAIGFCVDELV
jgi:hypothetical protein